MPPVSYTAPVVCPMNGPPLPHGAVLVDGGTVRAVGPASALRGEAARTHHVDGVLLPGLINASTRFEHADARADAAGAGTDRWDDDRWRRSAHRGVQEAVRAGVTAAGDVVARGAGVPPACRGGLVGDSFIEVPAGADTGALVAALERALDQPAPGRRIGIAVSAAHEPGGFDPGLLAALADLASRRGAPLRIRGGAPVSALDECGALVAGASVEPARPLAFDEIDLLARRRVSVVAGPAAPAGGEGSPAGGAGAPSGELIERCVEAGVGVALGTGDERRPDVLVDTAGWATVARMRGVKTVPTAGGTVPVAELAVRLATVDGAAAAGWNGAGVLAPGARADLGGVAVITTPATVYADLLDHGRGRQVLTVVAGVRKARRDSADEPWPPVDRTER